MYSNEFEAGFSSFLERHEYDEAQQSLFSIVRSAYTAGWLAAGGSPLQEQRLFQLIITHQNRNMSRPQNSQQSEKIPKEQNVL